MADASRFADTVIAALVDASDITKRLLLSIGIGTGVTRTLTIPDADVDLGDIATNTIAIAANATDIAALEVPVTLSAGSESNDTITVAMTGAIGKYKATLYNAAMVEQGAAAFFITPDLAASAVSTNNNGSVIFDASAVGGNNLIVTDAVGASGAAVWLVVEPLSIGGSAIGSRAAAIQLQFDGS